jgi:hypothetical protein
MKITTLTNTRLVVSRVERVASVTGACIRSRAVVAVVCTATVVGVTLVDI